MQPKFGHPTQHLGTPREGTLRYLLGKAKTLAKYRVGVPFQPYPTVYFRLSIFSCVPSPNPALQHPRHLLWRRPITLLTSVSTPPTPPIASLMPPYSIVTAFSGSGKGTIALHRTLRHTASPQTSSLPPNDNVKRCNLNGWRRR